MSPEESLKTKAALSISFKEISIYKNDNYYYVKTQFKIYYEKFESLVSILYLRKTAKIKVEFRYEIACENNCTVIENIMSASIFTDIRVKCRCIKL